MSELDSLKLDRTALSIGRLSERSDEKEYWISKTPYERLAATEIMRQIIYGYNPSTTRLQRILSVTQQPSR